MNEQAYISMDCLHEDYDLQDKLTRTKYLEMLNEAQIPQRVVACVKTALEKSGITAEQLHSVEAVGSSTRVQAVRDAIQDFLGKTIGSKMNAEEAVAIGCALYCARHSPASSTRAYDLIENTNVPVKVSWKTLNDASDTKVTDMEIFPVNYLIPKTKTRNVTINRVDGKPFEIALQYAPVKPEDVTYGNNVIAMCQVPKILKDNEMTRDAKVVVKLKAEPIGTFHFAEVEMQEEKEEIVEVPIEEKPEEGEKKDDTKEGSEIKTDAPKTRQEKKKVIHSTKISHQIFTPNELSEDQVTNYKKIENDMTAQDDLIISTANAKNELETYVYAASEKVNGVWKDFGTKQERDAIEELCGQITVWLYDDGADVTRAEYESRLKSVKDLAEKLNTRYREWEEVPNALEMLQLTINSLRNEANSKEEKFAHIKEEELQKVVQQCDDAHKYLEERMEAYKSRAKTNDPVFLASDLKMRMENLNINCKKILNTPKPIPKKEEPKKEEPKKEEAKPEESKTEEKPAAKEPTVEMDTDVD